MLCVKRLWKEERKQQSHVLPYRCNPSWAGRMADLSARLGYSFHNFKPSAMFIVLAYNMHKHTQRHTRTDIPRVPQRASLSRSIKEKASTWTRWHYQGPWIQLYLKLETWMFWLLNKDTWLDPGWAGFPATCQKGPYRYTATAWGKSVHLPWLQCRPLWTWGRGPNDLPGPF